MMSDRRRRGAIVVGALFTLAITGCARASTEPPLPTIGPDTRAVVIETREALAAWEQQWRDACEGAETQERCRVVLTAAVPLAHDAGALYDAVLDHAPGTPGAPLRPPRHRARGTAR